MPAVATQFRDVSRSSVSSEDWVEFLRTVDPLAAWRKVFEDWKTGIQRLREMEHEDFFQGRDKEEWQRIHRGWVCSLISDGEMLAVMLRRTKQEEKAEEECMLLDLCLENLRSTLLTWHFTQELNELKSQA